METKCKRMARHLLQDALVLLVLGSLLYCGVFWQFFDVAFYQCYTVAFWEGWLGLQKLPAQQCAFLARPNKGMTFISQDWLLHAMQQWRVPPALIHFVAAQSPYQPYHTLPQEYPWLTLLPFSLGLIVPADWYGIAFAIEMLLFVGCIYFVLQHWRSRQAALAFSLYLLVGGLSTALARFDIIPAALTLFALICAVEKRWNWAFALLALATLSKFYPISLLVPFSLALQQETQGKWYAWRKWLPIGIFAGICALDVAISMLLSVAGTLAPLGYFSNRPVEVESLSASILWLVGKNSLRYVYSFHSINALSPLSSSVTLLVTVLLVVGLPAIWWQQWQKHIDLAMACLLTLLIVIITGKIFSPQYLIWVIPLAAYVGQTDRLWLLFWTSVGYLTSWIYPYIFSMSPDVLRIPSVPEFYPVTMVRNFLLLGFILFVLIYRSCLDRQLS